MYNRTCKRLDDYRFLMYLERRNIKVIWEDDELWRVIGKPKAAEIPHRMWKASLNNPDCTYSTQSPPAPCNMESPHYHHDIAFIPGEFRRVLQICIPGKP